MLKTIAVTAPGGAAARTNSERWALVGLALSALSAALGTSIANVGLPSLALAFDAPFQQVRWVVLAYLLGITALVVGAGRLGDRIGRRRLLLAGVLLFALASALCAAAPTLALLIAARALQGLAAAIMMALTLAFVGETVPKARAGSAIGLLGTMSAIGTALGPPLGGALIAGFGWRSIFMVGVPVGLVSWALLRRHLPVARRPATTAATPLIPLAMLRDPTLSTGLATSALVSTVMMATLVVGPFYLSQALGLAPAIVGLVLAVGPLAAALTGVPAGRLSDRFGALRMTLVGLVGIGLGSLALWLTPLGFGSAGYIAPIVVITVGYALFQTANNAAVMADVGPDTRGVVSGLLNLARNLGLVAGASAMGAVFAFASVATDGSATSPEAVATGMRTTFAVAAALIVVALAIAGAGARRARVAQRAPASR